MQISSVAHRATIAVPPTTPVAAKMEGNFENLFAPLGDSAASSPAAAGSAPTGSATGDDATVDTGTLAGLLTRRTTTVAANAAAATAATASASAPTTDTVFDQADTDGNGTLSKDEFITFDASMNPNGPHLVEAATGRPVDGTYMFSIVDQMGLGFVTREQVKQHGYVQPN